MIKAKQFRIIRRTWRVLSGAFLLLGILATYRLLAPGGTVADALGAGLLLLGFAASRANRNAVVAREAGRRVEAESFARILRGLARSVSPDAVLGAIVAELANATEADHVVVVRRRPDRVALDATLVTSRSGVDDATAVLPIVDLEDEVDVPVDAIAIAIDSDGFDADTNAARPRSRARSSSERGIVVDVLTVADTARRWVDDVGRAAIGRFAVPVQGRAATIATVGIGPSARISGRIAARVRTVFGLNHLLAVPLQIDGAVIGAIIVSRRAAQPWSASSRRLLAGAAVEAAATLARTTAQRDAEERATTDVLTGLPNRRYFDEFCALLGRRRRSQDTVGILMVDIDHFKSLNDTHGHALGDEVLRAVARAIAGAVRDDDVPARVGGEEFAVLLRNPSPDVATEVGERVRAAVGALDLRELGIPAVSVSVGVAVSRFEEQPIVDILAEADTALYAAKRGGRDRVVAAA